MIIPSNYSISAWKEKVPKDPVPTTRLSPFYQQINDSAFYFCTQKTQKSKLTVKVSNSPSNVPSQSHITTSHSLAYCAYRSLRISTRLCHISSLLHSSALLSQARCALLRLYYAVQDPVLQRPPISSEVPADKFLSVCPPLSPRLKIPITICPMMRIFQCP